MTPEDPTNDGWSGWIPVLPTADATRSVRFYCDVLGFSKDWEHRFADGCPLYVQVSRGQIGLHLNEHGDPAKEVSLCLGVPDVDAVYAEFAGRGLVTDGPPQDREYGVREFSFTDPDGHHVVVATRLADFDTAPGRTP